MYTQTTYYSRDAQGNVMATYQMSHDTLTWKTSGIYGSSRVGEYHADKIIDIGGSKPSNPLPAKNYAFYRGHKRYELSNHLGNVLVVISDKRTVECISGNQSYEADIVSAQDYYPFGMLMPGRIYSSEAYGYGFNGKEKDDEVSGGGNNLDFGARVYDSRLGRFLSLDPDFLNYAWQSTYAFAANGPISFIDYIGRGPVFIVSSPMQAAKIKSALENQDYAEVYRILYYAAVTDFVDKDGKQSDFMRKRVKNELGIEVPKGSTLIDGGAKMTEGVVLQGIFEDNNGNLVVKDIGIIEDPAQLDLFQSIVTNPQMFAATMLKIYSNELTNVTKEIETLKEQISTLEVKMDLKKAFRDNAAKESREGPLAPNLATKEGRQDGAIGATLGHYITSYRLTIELTEMTQELESLNASLRDNLNSKVELESKIGKPGKTNKNQ